MQNRFTLQGGGGGCFAYVTVAGTPLSLQSLFIVWLSAPVIDRSAGDFGIVSSWVRTTTRARLSPRVQSRSGKRCIACADYKRINPPCSGTRASGRQQEPSCLRKSREIVSDSHWARDRSARRQLSLSHEGLIRAQTQLVR